MKDIKINVITIATPTVNAKDNLENPATHAGILNSHLHIYNEIDGVQTKMANAVDGESYKRTYNFKSTINIKLPSEEVKAMYTKFITVNVPPLNIPKTVKRIDGIGAHSVDFEHPEYIEKKIDEGKIPKPKQ